MTIASNGHFLTQIVHPVHKSSNITAFKKQVNPHKVLLIGNSGIKWQDLLKMNPAELF